MGEALQGMEGSQAIEDEVDWRARVWEVLFHYQKADGSPPRFCLDDHGDHVHMLLKCGCPRNCPTRNFRIECTVEMICELVPRENMHIHENAPSEKPTAENVIANLSVVIFKDQENCSCCVVCCGSFSRGEETAALPCGHLYHRECIVPWLQRQNTCPTCRFELPAAGEGKQLVRVGEGNEAEAQQAMVQGSSGESSALEDFLLADNSEEAEDATVATLPRDDAVWTPSTDPYVQLAVD